MAEKSTNKSSPFGAMPAFSQNADLTKIFGEMKMPAMPDMEAVVTANRRNLEALAEANRLALEGAQAVARRNMEIIQSTMSGLTESIRELSESGTPAARAAKQADLLKQAYENAVANTRELGDLIQKSNTEAMGKLNQRFSEAMSEMKTLFKK